MRAPSQPAVVFRLLLAAAALAPAGAAAAPPEVGGVRFADASSLAWNPVIGASHYNVYRGNLSELASGVPPRCHGFRLTSTSFSTPAPPPPAAAFVYLVTAESPAQGEGTAGSASSGVPRPLLGSCTAVMRNHLLDRAGFGWDEWSRDRIRTLGLDGYLEEQLQPSTIDESDNLELNERLAAILPPESVADLVAHQVVRGVYSRRQLEQQAVSFWVNHFNTFWLKLEDWFNLLFPECESPGVPPPCDPLFPALSQSLASQLQLREMERFRSLALDGNFRELLEASALSPAMLIYLDMVLSVAGNPNENYARELMELSAMGVDGGYTQQDVEQLARALTGWSVCKKAAAEMDDPLAPCIASYWEHQPYGQFTAHFDPALHDCASKTIFLGTPQEFTFPDSCGDPAQALQELELALDQVAAHPSTPRFISRKLLEKFVVEEPTEAAIDALVAEWNDATNPHGIGDLEQVMRSALGLARFLDPDEVGTKIRTPLEHAIAALRATRGRTDGRAEVVPFLSSTAGLPFLCRDPTGWPEAGFHWINTNATLDRQNFGYALAVSTDPDFAAQVTLLLSENGVSTAPGNAAAIVDFFADVLFGGALTPAERQRAIEFLNTDDLGQPGAYDAQDIREVVGLLLGYPQFQEQ